jgi:hypothetical protein
VHTDETGDVLGSRRLCRYHASPSSHTGISTGAVIGVVISGVVAVLVFSIVFVRMRRRRHFQRVPLEEYPDANEIMPLGRPISAFTDGNRYSAASDMSGLGRPVSHACMCHLFCFCSHWNITTPRSRVSDLWVPRPAWTFCRQR